MNSIEKNLAEVYVAADEIEAKHLQLLLADNHIASRIVGAGLIGGSGDLPPGFDVSPRLWVDNEYAEAAREICIAWERERNAKRANRNSVPLQDWQCSQCEEQVPGDFEICWQCQTPKQDTN